MVEQEVQVNTIAQLVSPGWTTGHARLLAGITSWVDVTVTLNYHALNLNCHHMFSLSMLRATVV